MSERAIHLGVLIGGLALAAWAFTRPASNPPHLTGTRSSVSGISVAASPLALIPSGSAFLLSADIGGLVRSPFGAEFARRFGQLGRTSELSALCGFDPLTRLTSLALAVPSAGREHETDQAGDFGVVASGAFTAAEILRCASAAITQRGGEQVVATLGGFSSVRDRKAGGGEVAAKNGLFIVSGGSYFRELLDSAEGTAKRAQGPRDARHAELRSALGSGEISATWLLSEGWFQRLSGSDDARLSPLGALKALGARVRLGPRAELRVLLDCADADGAVRVKSLLTELRSSLPALGLSPALTELAQHVEVTTLGARLQLDSTLSPAQLSALLDALFDSETTPAKR